MHRSLDVVPEQFANLTKEDVPNSFKYYSDFFSMLEEVCSASSSHTPLLLMYYIKGIQFITRR